MNNAVILSLWTNRPDVIHRCEHAAVRQRRGCSQAAGACTRPRTVATACDDAAATDARRTRGLSSAIDLDAHRRDDVGVQPDRHVDDAELLQRLVEVEARGGRSRRRVCACTASAMSEAVTEPKSRPPRPARAVIVDRAAGELRRRAPRAASRSRASCGLTVAAHRVGLLLAPGRRLDRQALAARGSCARSRRRRRRCRPSCRGCRRRRAGRSFIDLRPRAPTATSSARRRAVDRASTLDRASASVDAVSLVDGLVVELLDRSPARARSAARLGALASRSPPSPRSPRSRRRPLLRCVTWRTLYGSNAISRATLIARATAACCCWSLPVTRRARIFARSDMKRRSRLTSL